MIDLLRWRAYHGPSPWARCPVIRLQLRLPEPDLDPAPAVGRTLDRLPRLLPTFRQGPCSRAQTAGTPACLAGGVGHLVEHLALELQRRVGHEVTWGETRPGSETGTVEVLYGFEDESVGHHAGVQAIDLLESLLRGNTPALDDALEALRKVARSQGAPPGTLALLREARRRGIPALPLGRPEAIQLGQGRNQRRLFGTFPSTGSAVAVAIAGDRALSWLMLEEAGIPVPDHGTTGTLEGALDLAEDLGFPVVVRPATRCHGVGISVDVRGEKDLESAFELARGHAARVIVERAVTGRDFRVLVVNGRVVEVVERGPVPGDRTGAMHSENAEMALHAARLVGLDVAEVDIVCPEIGQPVKGGSGAVIDVTPSPSLVLDGSVGEGASAIVDMLFPPGAPARIPVIAVTGTNGKTTTARMCAHIQACSGRRVGLTTTDGIYVDGRCLRSGDLTGPWSARAVLQDPTVEVAVLETARGGILRAGLAIDQCDVAALLNVTEDHLGQDGIHTLDDLARVKGLLLEIVPPHGWGVLNAEDAPCRAHAHRCAGRVAWFTLDARLPFFVAHVGGGGVGATCEDGMLVLIEEGRHMPVTALEAIPATHGGRSGANIKNSLAAALACHLAGLPPEDIRKGLETFEASYDQAPGRLNLVEVQGFRVLMDYAHNVAAYEEIVRFVASLPKARAIGVVAGPGDRPDAVLRRLGEIAAATFDVLVIKEDDDLRGRKPGEAAAFLEEGVRLSGRDRRAGTVELIPSEIEAVERGLSLAREGDLLVVLADQPGRTWQQVLAFDQRGREGG